MWDSFSFPEFDSSVDGVESVGSLRFTQVGSELANKVAAVKAKLMRSNAFFHLETFQGIGSQMLDHLPKLCSDRGSVCCRR